MKKLDLNELIDLAFNHARTVLIEYKQASMVPAFSILRKDHTVDITGAPWSNDEEKAEAIAWMKKYLKEQGALAYCVVGEAWSATYDKHQLGANLVPPAKSDRRVEVVIAVAADREGHKVMRAHEIIRGDDGSVIDFSKAQAPSSFTDMAGLLD
jgi:hypothetical protein